MNKYVALLRGINLGGRTVKMDKLRAMFEDMGYTGVRTLLASGNVVFASKEGNAGRLQKAIEAQFAKSFGFEADILLRSAAEIGALIKAAPFKSVKTAPGVRMHITFLNAPVKSKLKFPYKSPDGGFRVLAVDEQHLAVVVQPKGGTLDYMDFIIKEVGKETTTRTWNTVQKIHDAMSEKSD